MLDVIDPNIVLLMERFGQTFKYYQATICSCVKENDGTFALSCDCIQGFRYAAASEIVKGIRQQVSWKILHTPQGVIYNGGAQITLPKLADDVEQLAHKTLGRGDIFVVENKIKKNSDILLKGTRDFIFAFDVEEILKVSRKGTIYNVDTDYTVAKDQSTPIELTMINWEAGRGPENGEYYSVDFTCKQQFKVWEDAGNDRGTDDEQLPKKVLCTIRRFVETQPNNVDGMEETLHNKIW